MTKSLIELENIVNSSGFIFQVGVAHAVTDSEDVHGFKVVAVEHPWHSDAGDGFIDLIAESGPMRLVCECKRTRDANWIFLVENHRQQLERARLYYSHVVKLVLHDYAWADFALTTDSYESAFCMIRGQGENDSPLLERLASRLVISVESLAKEESELTWHRSDDEWRLYLPMIITNANLFVCRYLPEDIDLETGRVSRAAFDEVPAVRFRKALTTSGQDKSRGTLAELSAVQERTILVVNSRALVTVLTNWRAGVIRDSDALWHRR